MTIATASGNPTSVLVRESGAPGLDGVAGADGAGFNNVRGLLLDNPTLWLYKKNRLANVLSGLITITRPSGGTFKDMHDLINLETDDFPREGGSGWLIEPARTNLCLQSETFDNATWVKSNLTVSADATTAPNNQVTADRLIEDSAATIKDISQLVTVATATKHTLSVFVKANSRNFIKLQDVANSGSGAFFDLATGAIATIDAGIIAKIEAFANGFFRCSIQSTSTSTSGGMKIQLADADGGGSYSGDGTSGVFVFGAQIEVSDFETSYIATIAISILRAAESHKFNVLNNVPFLDDGFSFLLRIDNYNEQSGSQDILKIEDRTSGSVFKINTTSGGLWEALIKGSDAIDYKATTTINAISSATQTVIVTVSNGVINIFINGNTVNGTNAIATLKTGSVKTDGVVDIALLTDFRVNIQNLIFFDFVLNDDELIHLSE